MLGESDINQLYVSISFKFADDRRRKITACNTDSECYLGGRQCKRDNRNLSDYLCNLELFFQYRENSSPMRNYCTYFFSEKFIFHISFL